ncbi:hypothetical protein I3843_08G081700 [Carya illinoinensis]|nr:hypothetical protein I3843_08G081700 [Carya illinoinensis]
MKIARGTLAIILPLALAFLLSFAACTGSTTNTWCIAKPSTNNDKLLHNVEYSCGEANVDCRSIQLGGTCFHPNNAVSHASFAMNLFYQDSGKHPWNCDFNGTGLIVSDNPSFGLCQYPA